MRDLLVNIAIVLAAWTLFAFALALAWARFSRRVEERERAVRERGRAA